MRRRMTGSLAAATLFAAAATAWASPASIGIYFARDASECDATQTIGTVLPMYVLAIPGTDWSASGITGAGFLIEGVPPGWWTIEQTPNPLARQPRELPRRRLQHRLLELPAGVRRG